jgi:hypothetical protein
MLRSGIDIHPYLILKARMTAHRSSEKSFATISGMSSGISPYVSHSKTPATKSKNMANDKSAVDFVFQVSMTWGRKAKVVQQAAASHRYVNADIFNRSRE